MVGILGIEPSLHAPEACVLPVYDIQKSIKNYQLRIKNLNFPTPIRSLVGRGR